MVIERQACVAGSGLIWVVKVKGDCLPHPCPQPQPLQWSCSVAADKLTGGNVISVSLKKRARSQWNPSLNKRSLKKDPPLTNQKPN